MVEFNVQLEPSSVSAFKTVRYTAEFVNGDGKRIVLTREKQVESALLKQPYTAASLLSHILEDFMAEVRGQ